MAVLKAGVRGWDGKGEIRDTGPFREARQVQSHAGVTAWVRWSSGVDGKWF